ncbi:glycosyl hydrolase [Mangrovibacterium marinum]|uniref:Mannan endo-1,4-beta-mannosidase n=1 Tax=Mangrovibacterium marinum TaxID=1639118 RepID=A0A2T5C5E4_9BACT|nr:glycosyl hydrolase [Mangrovibacterium marinum]PTN10134.1 mannan endo-1,4-beta-mannosidase [Mangrovibacterium marinum]
MKKLMYTLCCLILVAGGLWSCSSSDGDDPVVLDPPALVSSSPVDGATGIAAGEITLVLTFDQNVTSPSALQSTVSLDGATISSFSARLTTVTIQASGLQKGNSYELVIPAGVIQGPTKVGTSEITIHFSTEEEVVSEITTSLAVANPSTEAQHVYDFLLENYGTKIVSSTMANVNWNVNEAEWVHQHTGKYPAMAAFDYIHFIESPANWIDYTNTTVVEDWWNNNGLVAASWHWRVPASEGSSTYTYATDATNFSTANATVEGTWENDVVKADLAKMAAYLKLLQAKNIPVIWRPLHEAAGNIYEFTGGTAWFWWGNDGAEAYKALWKYVFDYFEAEGLNNLIWVWTTQTKDQAFYPGDDYVDIVGRDVYNNADASDIAAEFQSIQETYPTKMVTLSECGSVATISDQWSAGAQWSFFMPWYDYDRTVDVNSAAFTSTDHEHANAAWWTDAVANTAVITRDEMPDLK